jgi:hypothetical protein
MIKLRFNIFYEFLFLLGSLLFANILNLNFLRITKFLYKQNILKKKLRNISDLAT